MNIGEILIGALAPALEAVATAKLTELFEKMYKNDPEKHSATLRSMYIGVGQLKKLTKTTKTKIDDAVVSAIVAAIEMSAASHDVDLTDEGIDS